jgi:hypothetical protein
MQPTANQSLRNQGRRGNGAFFYNVGQDVLVQRQVGDHALEAGVLLTQLAQRAGDLPFAEFRSFHRPLSCFEDLETPL